MIFLLMACDGGASEDCLDTANSDFAAEFSTLYCDVVFACYGPDPVPPFDLQSCYNLEYVVHDGEEYDPCLARTCLNELADALTCENVVESISDLDLDSCSDAFYLHDVTGE